MTDMAIPCIMGPTASGKTGIAVALAERFPVRIISVDSAQVYRGMDIGTAKPDAGTLARAPHRLVDILDPAEAYSAARFCNDAVREIEAALAAGEWPLLVGGTMLYFRALEHGLADLPDADDTLRRAIEDEARQDGWEALHRQLQRIDPDSAARIHHNDAQRIQRALEVYRISGRPLSALQRERELPASRFRLVKWVLAPGDRAELNRRIAGRFEGMLAEGFIAEVEALRGRGDLGLNHPSIRAVGYRQVWQYLDGEFGRDALLERGIIATRQFAKRQMTWLRRETDATWLDPERDDAPGAIANWFHGA